MSRQVQTESAYVQTVPDSKCLCPDRPRRKVDMSRLSCVQNFSCVLRAFEDKYVQTITDRNSICPDFRAFLSRPSCTPSSCVRRQICPDHPRPKQYMSRLSCVHVQTIVRSCPDFRAFTRPEKKLHPGVQCYSLKMKTERVPKFHKSICLRFIKKFDFKSLFL